MSARQIYLDNNATTQPLPQVIEAMAAAMTGCYGNPSSSHSRGDAARLVVDEARQSVADLLGAAADTILFTSGATEANNTAILSCLSRNPKYGRIVTTTVEHSSVLKLCERLETSGTTVTRVPVDARGMVDLEQLALALSEPADLVSVQWVNNETGVIQPIEDIAALASVNDIPLHVDAAQAVGKLMFRVAELSIDYLSVTAHKIHGAQGVGALYVRPNRRVLPLLHGGPQEFGLRAGTENVPGIAGFGRAADVRRRSLLQVATYLGTLRDAFEERVLAELPESFVNGGAAPRVPNSTNISFGGIDGQALVSRLDQQGISCSQSSACTNLRPEPSYVLRAMGLTEGAAYSSVRFSFSELNTPADAQDAAEVIISTVNRLREFEGAGAFAA